MNTCATLGLDACSVNATDKRSLDFTVNRTLMKIFRTYCQEIITECQIRFAFPPVHDLIAQRKMRFLSKYMLSDNIIHEVCSDTAQCELNEELSTVM